MEIPLIKSAIMSDEETNNRRERERLIQGLVRSRHPAFTFPFATGNGGITNLSLLQISHLEADGTTSVANMPLETKPKKNIGMGLNFCTKELTEFAFIRIHRSYLVNVSWIKSIEKIDGQWVCVLDKKIRLDISRRKQREVFKQLKVFGIVRNKPRKE